MGRIVFFETIEGFLFPMHRVIRALQNMEGDKINVQLDIETPERGWETVYREEWVRARKLAEA